MTDKQNCLDMAIEITKAVAQGNSKPALILEDMYRTLLKLQDEIETSHKQ